MTFHYPDALTAQILREAHNGACAGELLEKSPEIVAIAYHTSLARDEAREIRIRILLARPEKVLSEANRRDADSEHPYILRLAHSRPCSVDELRRIAASAPFESALVCVGPADDEPLRIWGIAWTGTQWLAPTWGGRDTTHLDACWTSIHITGPGRISVYNGDRFIAGLERGALMTRAMDVFGTTWLSERFASVRKSSLADNVVYNERNEKAVRFMSQHMIRRALWLMRAARHGGMLLVAEASDVDALLDGPLRAKYAFDDDSGRQRYRLLMREVLAAVDDGAVEAIEKPLFELSRFIAALSAVDGAVLLTKHFDTVAFGVEILSGLSSPARVMRALDAEGETTIADHEENVGTRHRAAYRFVMAHPNGLAIVVSQDGSVRFVISRDGQVTYFEQHLVG